MDNVEESIEDEVDDDELLEAVLWTSYFERLPPRGSLPFPSSVVLLKLELKVLPSELKCAFLGKESTFPMVVLAQLDLFQKGLLLNVLRRHKKIGRAHV